jgi:ABC-type multidrug transport system ATPase subunit
MVAIIERGELIYAGSVRDIMQKVGSGTVVQIVVEDRHALDRAQELRRLGSTWCSTRSRRWR